MYLRLNFPANPTVKEHHATRSELRIRFFQTLVAQGCCCCCKLRLGNKTLCTYGLYKTTCTRLPRNSNSEKILTSSDAKIAIFYTGVVHLRPMTTESADSSCRIVSKKGNLVQPLYGSCCASLQLTRHGGKVKLTTSLLRFHSLGEEWKLGNLATNRR